MIQDTPPGASDAECKQLFDPLFRLEASRSRRTGGAGLGLAIISKILEQLGSQLNIESELGKGTTMSFAFPIKIIQNHAPVQK